MTASAPSAAGRRWRAASFEQEVERGALHVGSPETVARKIAKTAKALGIVRFDLKYSRRHARARQAHALHRALRHEGHSAGAGDDGAGIVAGLKESLRAAVAGRHVSATQPRFRDALRREMLHR